MTSHESANGSTLEELINAYLDGELTAAETAAVERRLQTDHELASRISALQGIETWMRTTRPSVPRTMARRVEEALAEESARSTERETLDAARAFVILRWFRFPLVKWGRPRLRFGLAAGVAALAAVVLLRVGDETRDGLDVGVTEEAGLHSHEFVFHAPGAKEVCLVGNFNRWSVCETRLEHVGDGRWRVTLPLPRGRYEYMFVVDRQWQTDPEASSYANDGFGNRNAILLL